MRGFAPRKPQNSGESPQDPNDRTPRQAAVISATGQLQTLAPQQANAGEPLHYHQDLPPCLSCLLAIERESAVFGAEAP